MATQPKRYYRDKDYSRFTKKKKPKGVSRFRTDRHPEIAAQVRGEKAEAKNSRDPKKVARRARRGLAALETHAEVNMKPISEWDFEELERGRPRGPKGGFSGPAPKFMTRGMHEKIIDRYKSLVKEEMSKKAPSALKVLNHILLNEDEDEDGKPIVSANTKLDAAKLVLEHLLGKPKQETKTDISVALQGMLAHALVQPGPDGQGLRVVRGRAALASAELDEDEVEGEIVDDDDEDDD